MSNFSDASKVLQTIQAGDTVELVRSSNRTKILNAANCVPPLDKAQADRMGVKINVNFGELAVLLTHAVTQMLSAFTSNQYYFNVDLKRAPDDSREDWSSIITTEMNDIIMENDEYYTVMESKWSSVAKYGIGAMTWRHPDKWKPKFCPLSDLRIATDTTLDFANLNWYAQRVPYTLFELMNEAFDGRENNGWNKKAIAAILKNYKEQNTTDAVNNIDWDTDIESLASIVKQNGGFYGSNALPTIPIFHFYFADNDKEGVQQWYMRAVPDAGVQRGDAETEDGFLWASKEPVGKSWRNLLNCQFGDLSFDDPKTFGAVRGLGFLLLEPTFYSNLTRCRFLQHVHDNFNILLRISDPAEKARALLQEFNNLGIVRSGVTIVPTQERHQIREGLVESAIAQMKQLQGEASSSYTQQADTGTQKEQTAFETRVKAEQVNAMTSGIILKGSKGEDSANREICRRFFNKDSKDPDVIEFRQRVIDQGVPEAWLNMKYVKVTTVTPIGMGNPTIAQAAIQQLQQLAPKLTPQAQQEINHESVLVLTKDWRKAKRWAPVAGKPTQSDATREAIGLFATLLIAAPGSVPPPQNNYIDQIDVLMPLLAGKVMLYTKRNNMATPEEAMGLQNVLTYISQAVQALGMDQTQKERVKKYTDSLAQIGNEIKALTQRGAAALQAQQKQGQDGKQAEAKQKMQTQQAEAAQKMRLENMRFAAEERRKQAAFAAEQRRRDAGTYADVEHDRFKAMAGAHAAHMKSFQESAED